MRRAEQALKSGCDGLIASGPSVKQLRQAYPQALLVTPGIRPKGTAQDDHKRSLTPQDAILGGSDYLVVGRPIRNSSNRKHQAEQIIADIEIGLSKRS